MQRGWPRKALQGKKKDKLRQVQRGGNSAQLIPEQQKILRKKRDYREATTSARRGEKEKNWRA